MTARLLADVDTGIDDACALLHLVGAHRLGVGPELVAVTTTGGNATARDCALNTAAVLDLAGRHSHEKIVAVEDKEKWGFKYLDEIWSEV